MNNYNFDDYDYYEVLGVNRSATQKEIEIAFKQRMKAYHPDINKDKVATTFTKMIIKAYEVLSDPQKRNEYDNRPINEFKATEEKMRTEQEQHERERREWKRKEETYNYKQQRAESEKIENEEKRLHRYDHLNTIINIFSRHRVPNIYSLVYSCDTVSRTLIHLFLLYSEPGNKMRS